MANSFKKEKQLFVFTPAYNILPVTRNTIDRITAISSYGYNLEKTSNYRRLNRLLNGFEKYTGSLPDFFFDAEFSVNQNLITYTENFDQTPATDWNWDASVSGSALSNSWQFTISSASNEVYQNWTTPGGDFVFAVEVKGNRGETLSIRNDTVVVNHTFSGSWERVSVTATTTAGVVSVGFGTGGSATVPLTFEIRRASLMRAGFSGSYYPRLDNTAVKVLDLAGSYDADFVNGNSVDMFDGNNLAFDSVSSQSIDSLYSKLTGDQTWFLRIKTNQTAQQWLIGSDVAGGLSIYLDSANRIRVITNELTTIYIGTTTLSVGTSYDIAVSYSPTTGVLNVYLDGVKDSATNAQTLTASNLKIGKRYNNSSYFDGTMKHILAFNSVLTDKQVSQILGLLNT